MGTLEVFSQSYCSSKNSCVLVDAYLELFLCLCSLLVVCGLCVASRCCWLCSSRENAQVQRAFKRRTRDCSRCLRRILRKLGIELRGKTSPLPLAVIKKDATAARIQGHKNSQQQGEAFIMQTQRMQHMDFAAQSPPLSEEVHEEPAIPPLIFPEDVANVVSSTIPEGINPDTSHKRPPVAKRDPSKHMLAAQMTRQRSKSAMNPPKGTIQAKTRALSVSLSRSSRNVLSLVAPKVAKESGRHPQEDLDSSSSERTGSLKRRFLIFKKRVPTRENSRALFNEPSYETKHGMAELSPEDRAENERRASLRLRDKRRVSVGESSLLQFEVGGDQASVYEVKLREVNLVKRLASGPLSEVYAAIWRDTKVAVKLLMPREGVVDHLEEAVKNFRREIWVMHALKHPNILKLLGASLTQSCYVLVMEYMPNGSLYDYLRDAANFFPQQLVVTSAFDIASGMAHIHDCDVLQRDLKSKNLLLSENLVVKVADFGLARFKSKQYGSYTWVGTPFWAAPEVIRHEVYDEKADVYSYGIVLWELIERKDPYDNLNAYQVPLQVANEGLRPSDFTRPAPLGLDHLMRQCWDADPEQRPSFADISQTLSTWMRTPSSQQNGDKTLPMGIGLRNDSSVDLSAHIQREQNAANQAQLNRFAESHGASEIAIPITLSTLRRGLSTSRLQRAHTNRQGLTHSEIEDARINSTIGIPGLERYNNFRNKAPTARRLSPPPPEVENISRKQDEGRDPDELGDLNLGIE